MPEYNISNKVIFSRCPKNCPYLSAQYQNYEKSGFSFTRILGAFCRRYGKKLSFVSNEAYRKNLCLHDEGICPQCYKKTWIRKEKSEILFMSRGNVDGYKCVSCKYHFDFEFVKPNPRPTWI